jgi:hypothetical protein
MLNKYPLKLAFAGVLCVSALAPQPAYASPLSTGSSAFASCNPLPAQTYCTDVPCSDGYKYHQATRCCRFLWWGCVTTVQTPCSCS